MKITNVGKFMVGRIEDTAFTDKEKEQVLRFGNEETEEEILDMIAEAEEIADPKVLFGVCGIEDGEPIKVGDVAIDSALVKEKLSPLNRCFPYIASCSKELNEWAKQYDGDPIAEYWADEIKQIYLQKIMKEIKPYLTEHYHIVGHAPALNPGSIAAWPISGQEPLFAVLGGREFVKEQVGVLYTDSFLMVPNKSVSGIVFESEVFYENCQHCPIDGCPNRRAKRSE